MAPPVTASALIGAVRAVAVAEGRPGNEPARALDALERLPPQSMLTLRQAVDMLADDRGHMPGVAQSAVLQTFGGPRVASEVLALAGIFARRAPPRHCVLLPPQAEHHHDDEDAYLEACAARAPRASHARGRRGRGRGRGRNAPRSSDAERHRQEHVALPHASTMRPEDSQPARLRDVCLEGELRRRVYTLQSPPRQVRGALRQAMRSALELVHAAQDPASVEDGWKLFLLAPRMLLHRKRGQSHVPPAELARRAELLGSRRWCQLLDEAAHAADAHPERPANPRSRRTRAEPEDDAQRRADRAVALAHLGELSAARTALEAAPLAPSTDETIAALRDPTKRPQTRQVPLPDWLSNFQPEGGCTPLDLNKFCGNLRGARRGAAAASKIFSHQVA